LPVDAAYESVKGKTINTNRKIESKTESNSPPNRWTEYWQGTLIFSLLLTALGFFLPNAKSPLQAGLLIALLLFII